MRDRPPRRVAVSLAAIILLASVPVTGSPAGAAGDATNPFYEPEAVWAPPEAAPADAQDTVQVGNAEVRIREYGAVPHEVWRSGEGLYLESQGGEAVGSAYFLPWSPNTASFMRLPLDGTIESFLTPNMDGCAFIVGESEAGEAVAVHVNMQSINGSAADAYEAVRNRVLEPFFDDQEEKGIDGDEGYSEADLLEFSPELRAAEQTYRTAVEGSFDAARAALIERGVIGENSSIVSSTALPGDTAFVSGTRTSDGWNFRYRRSGGGASATELADGLGQVEVQPGDATVSAADEQDWATESSVEALRVAQDAVSGLGSGDVHADGATISAALRVNERVDEIFEGQEFPVEVSTERTGLISELDAQGVEYGAVLDEEVRGDFAAIAEQTPEVASRMSWSEVWTEGGPVYRGFRYAGRAFLVVGGALSIWSILHADNQALEAAQQTGGWIGGIAAGWTAGAATEASLAYLDLAGPFGWVATTAASLVAGGVGFAAGYRAGGEFYYMVEHPANDGRLARHLQQLETVPRPVRAGVEAIMERHDKNADGLLAYGGDIRDNFTEDEYAHLARLSTDSSDLITPADVALSLGSGLVTFQTGELEPTASAAVFTEQDRDADGFLQRGGRVLDAFTSDQFSYIAGLRHDRANVGDISPHDVGLGFELGLLRVSNGQLEPIP